MLLGVNIDHIATLRQTRREGEPDLLQAAKEAILGGADGITIHLREDRRHIQDRDVFEIKKLDTRLNLEMAVTEEMVNIACTVKPDFCCLVPEKREELTTEGGLDVIANEIKIRGAIVQLQEAGIDVSVFIDSDFDQIRKTKDLGADYIEIHTGVYANALRNSQDKELEVIKKAANYATEIGLKVNAGHGLKYHNVKPVAEIREILELNIGHSIISRAVFVGMKEAVNEMKDLVL